MKTRILPLFLIIFLGAGCSQPIPQETVENTRSPIYVTFAGHIEDSKSYTDCDVFEQKREPLLRFVALLHEHDIPFNLQASYEWFEGVRNCDTNEPNLMEHLATEWNVEIDVHQEGASEAFHDVTSGNNLADIRYLASQVTEHVTETSGFQWDNQNQYERLQNGEAGRLFPDFTWYPELLIGGVSTRHTNGDFSDDMTAMGVWIPEGFNETDFFRHDRSDDARMIYIGSGPNQHMADWGPSTNCHFQSSADFISVLDDYIENGTLPPDEIYTYTLFIPQRILFSDAEHQHVLEIINSLSSLAADGHVSYQHFTDVATIWKETYDSNPHVLSYETIDPADYTCN